MKNVKGFAVANDGNMKRIAVTYDVIDDSTGKPLTVNAKANSYVMDEEALVALDVIDKYIHSLINSEE